MRRWLRGTTYAAITSFAFSATATEPTRDDEVGIRIIDPEPTARHRVRRLDGSLVGECIGNCRLHLSRGRYYLDIDGRDLRTFDADESRTIEVVPGSPGQRAGGVLLIVAGGIGTLFGSLGMVVSSANLDVHNNAEVFGGSLLACAAGLGGLVTGVAMVRSSGTSIRTHPDSAPSLAVVPTRNGVAAGMTFSF